MKVKIWPVRHDIVVAGYKILNPEGFDPVRSSFSERSVLFYIPKQPQSLECSARAFTLIELMAVVLVICILSAIGFSVGGYVQRRMAVTTTKSQISTMEAALELYKSD